MVSRSLRAAQRTAGGSPTVSTSRPGVVAILGLRTFVGRELALRLATRSPAIRVVGLDLRRPFGLDERVRFHRVDLTDPRAGAGVAAILERERVEAVLHAAFRTDPTPDLEADHELDTIGSLHVMNACAAAKVRRLVVASSTMLYGPYSDNPNYLGEDHPLRGHPAAHSVRDRIEMERLLVDWRERHPDVEVSVLRACWAIGPTFSNRIVHYLSLPVVPLPIGYDPLLQLVHEQDLLDAFERALLTSQPGVFNVVGSGVLPVSVLFRLAGRRTIPLPAPLLDRLSYHPSQGQTGDPPAAFFDYLRYLWVADGQRGWDAFGEPAYSTKEAWISFVSSRRMRRYR
ncbi:MAG: NAD-dependent epimerase/dehydratase family protein [Deltaproteobacteria bacterium]|nr:MAG: NAD-dependent epimerase/dehydratase family protein [Deltaproteobacteria bacterium]